MMTDTIAALREQHRPVEVVDQDGDDWAGCICGEQECAVLNFLASEADRGTCGNCRHAPDIHSPVNRELCAVPGCDCPGLLTAAEADRGTVEREAVAAFLVSQRARGPIPPDAPGHWLDLASPDAVDVVARALQTPEVQDIAVHYEPDRAAAALIEAMRRDRGEPR